MTLIARNEYGRVYVRDFEIEKNIYLFLNDYYPQLQTYAVRYHDNVLDVYLKNSNYLEANILDQLQQEAQDFFQENMGIYFKQIRLNLK